MSVGEEEYGEDVEVLRCLFQDTRIQISELNSQVFMNWLNSASSSDRSDGNQGEEAKAMQNAAALSSFLETIGDIRSIFQ
jgi:hypothetical protein